MNVQSATYQNFYFSRNIPSKKSATAEKKCVNYYPFGLKHKGYNDAVSANGNSIAQKKLYNGKEFQDELGLNWHDYGARNYDASLGRWMNIDPLAQDYFDNSPYNYVANTPMIAFDPDGKRIAIVGNEEYVQGVLTYLFSLAQKSKRGAQLFMDAISSDRTLVIFDPNNKNLHGEVDGDGGEYETLGFDLSQANGELDASNGRNGESLEKTGETTLGHELSHFMNTDEPVGYLMNNGEKSRVGAGEVAAVRDENQIRREMGLDERTHYGGINVYGKKARQRKSKYYYDLVRDKNYTKAAKGATQNQFDSFFFLKVDGKIQPRGSYYRGGRYLNRNVNPSAEKPKPNKEFSLSEKKS